MRFATRFVHLTALCPSSARNAQADQAGWFCQGWPNQGKNTVRSKRIGGNAI